MRLYELEHEPTTFPVNWKVPRRMELYLDKGIEKVVWVDVDKVDEKWKLDRNFHVGPSGTGSAIAGRYQRFEEWMKDGQPVEMSEMGLGYRDLPSFTNGRHRFAWMRDHGAKAIPVITPVEEANRFEEKFGSNLRKTIITA